MNSSERKNNLLKKIQGSMFLERSLKDELIAQIPDADDDILTELEQYFDEAQQKQDDIVAKIVEHDATFVPRLKDFKRTQIRSFQKQIESKERTEEHAEDILHQM